MSDFDSSLPIKTLNAGDVIAKIADATTPSQQLVVNVDGSINANVSATNLDIRDLAFATDKVDVSGSSVTVTATNLDIRDLAFATDKVDVSGSTLGANSGVDIGDVTINNASGAAAVNIQDGGNSITVDGSVTVSATNLDIRDLAFATDKVDVSGSTVTTTNLPTTVDTNFGTVGASTPRSAAQIGNATGAASFGAGATSSQTLRVASNLYDATGTAFSMANPLPVAISTSTPGTEKQDYKAASSIAVAASDNHDYTAIGAFTLTQIESSASGKAKMLLAIETGVATGVFTSKAAQFNSSSSPNMTLLLSQPILVTAGVRVRVTMTNRDNQAMDLYSTILGNEA